MSRVLIVDDEEGYRKQLEIALQADGHEVQCAANGRQAIDIGTRCRPDVLVTDWMLQDDIHGLHVVQVLRAVLPSMQAIMITGFPSGDLRADADKAQVSDFIEKPFKLDRIRGALTNSKPNDAVSQRQPSLAVMEVDANGNITFANRRAKTLMGETEAGADAERLDSLFCSDCMPDLDAAADRWVVALPRSDSDNAWQLRAQSCPDNGGRLVVLRGHDDTQFPGHTLVEMLLGAKETKHVAWPFDGRVLVIDNDALVRNVFVAMLESCGAGCYAVKTVAEAVRLIQNDSGIRYIVVDADLQDQNTIDAVSTIKGVRPGLVIVGTSVTYQRDQFATLGVEYFLQKPWRVEDLIDTLRGRICNCIECGLPIPLRKPAPNEQAQGWMCAYCGARYHAVFDHDFPEDVQHNVRPTESTTTN